MRQAINNLQSTWTGLGFVSPDNVFKVCDQPHPVLIRAILDACHKGDIETAMEKLDEVWGAGYAAVDIVTTLFRVVKTMDGMAEAVKVCRSCAVPSKHLIRSTHFIPSLPSHYAPRASKLEFIRVSAALVGTLSPTLLSARFRIRSHPPFVLLSPRFIRHPRKSAGHT